MQSSCRRFNEVVESNRLLLLELDDRGKKHDRLKRDCSQLTAEKADAIAQFRGISAKLQTREDEIESFKRQVIHDFICLLCF